jgi:hypothetical protein
MTEDEKRQPSPETLRRRKLPIDERIDLIEEDKDAAALDRDELNRKWIGSVRAIVAVLLLTVAGGYVLGAKIDSNSGNAVKAAHKAVSAQAKAAKGEKALREYEIQSCHRGNERTVADNVSQAADFRFFTTTATLIRVSLAQPQPGQPPPSAEQRAGTLKFVKGLEADAKDKVWHHLIENCEEAVDHPSTYKLPGAVHFSTHRPPKGALEVQSGE